MCHNLQYEIEKSNKNNVTNKLRKMIYIMKQLREIIKTKNIRTIYLSIFEFLITYGMIGWGGASMIMFCHNFKNTKTQL